MTTPTKLTTVLAQIPDLLDLSIEDFHNLTVKDLKVKANLLKLNGTYKLKKKELVNAIWEELNNLKYFINTEAIQTSFAKQSILEAKKDDAYSTPITEVGEKTYQRLRDVAIKSQNIDEMKLKINSLVAAVAANEQQKYKFSTVKSRRTDLKEYIDNKTSLENPLLRDTVSIASDYFYTNILAFQKEDSLELNRQYKKRVKAKNRGEKIRVKIYNLVENCLKTLDRLDADEKPKWTKVSIALSLGTGRRMAEIHSLASFEYLDKYKLYFSGQAKTRDSEDAKDSYEIPTIFPAKLMIMALEYLDKCERRLSADVQKGDRKAVNKKFGMALSRAMDRYQEINYKALRAIYADLVWSFGKSEYEAKGIEKHTLYSDWLGHVDIDGQQDSTFMSYMTYAIDDLDAVKNLL